MIERKVNVPGITKILYCSNRLAYYTQLRFVRYAKLFDQYIPYWAQQCPINLIYSDTKALGFSRLFVKVWYILSK